MFILHLFVLLLQLLHGQRLTMALSGCVCTNPSSGLYGTWGNWTGLTPPICNGTCRQTWQTGLYTCKVTSLGGKLITTMNCSRTLYNKCDDPCPGQWGLWSPTAPCNVTCGSGKQEETRYCYKVLQYLFDVRKIFYFYNQTINLYPIFSQHLPC